MKKDVKTFLQHIMESIERIEEYIQGISKEDFMGNLQLQDAVIRRLEIIGEAVKIYLKILGRNILMYLGNKSQE